MKLAPKHYAFVAVALFVPEIAFEVVHAAIGQPWMGFGEVSSLVLGGVWSVMWLIAAGGMILHRQWGGGFGVAGALASLMQGMVVVAAGDRLGIVHLAAGVTLIFLMKRASPWFGWGLLWPSAAEAERQA